MSVSECTESAREWVVVPYKSDAVSINVVNIHFCYALTFD